MLYSPDHYTAITSHDQLDNVVCTGTEQKLFACSYNIGSVDSNTAVGMECGYSEHSNLHVHVCTLYLKTLPSARMRSEDTVVGSVCVCVCVSVT